MSDLLPELRALDRAHGSSSRTLRIGDWDFVLEGLDAMLASRLEARWGGFLVPASSDPPRVLLRVLRGGKRTWLPRAGKGESYRVEPRFEEGCPIVTSYHFALAQDEEPGIWRCALTEQDEEPIERALENAVRCMLARVAVEDGGFALHAAGVLDGSAAYLLAGPSRAGKTTAVRLLAPRRSLGDDFAVVVSRPEGWRVPAVPFDNAERASASPPEGLYPCAGIWRLHQADGPARVEPLQPARAIASLLACTALPWTFPDLASELMEQVRSFVASCRFEHLHFRRSPDFWPLLGGAG